ncbi:YidB family protein [Rhodoplanes sp. SY1]|uniref:YidB family protein n=1 Tax=Rhodoplanes sp. SY1 TaxID=3166646 RepID=UPI0038B4873D
MGLLDSLIAGAVQGAFRQLDTTALPSILSQILGRTDLGGFGGLLDALRRGGLDREVGSWLGQGANMDVSPDRLRNALGDRELGQMSQQAGLSIEDLLAVLAQHLPQTVDRMSPNGHLQDDPLEVNPDEGGSLTDQAGLDDIGRR